MIGSDYNSVIRLVRKETSFALKWYMIGSWDTRYSPTGYLVLRRIKRSQHSNWTLKRSRWRCPLAVLCVSSAQTSETKGHSHKKSLNSQLFCRAGSTAVCLVYLVLGNQNWEVAVTEATESGTRESYGLRQGTVTAVSWPQKLEREPVRWKKILAECFPI